MGLWVPRMGPVGRPMRAGGGRSLRVRVLVVRR